MKQLFLLAAFCVTLTSQAAEPGIAVPEPATVATPDAIKLPKGRCPTMPKPYPPATSVTGEFHFVARFLLKADGHIENIRVDGRGPRGFSQNIAKSITGYSCLPAETDQEIFQTFDFKVS